MDEAEAMLGPTSGNTVSQAMTHMTACVFFSYRFHSWLRMYSMQSVMQACVQTMQQCCVDLTGVMWNASGNLGVVLLTGEPVIGKITQL